jgi:ferric-dicitrate binding protein FerR (iron transport regulator)
VHPLYENFTTADFLTDDFFVNHQLLPTPESVSFWDDWLKTFPQCRDEWQQAVDVLDAIRLGLDSYARTYLSDEIIRQLLTRIKQTNATPTPALSPVRSLTKVYWAAAASVLLVLGVSFWLWTSRQSSPYEQRLATIGEGFHETLNTTDRPQTVKLPDKSVVWLAPESRLSYPSNFGKQNRQVYLSGEATFEVTRDAHKPFLVHANELVTKVLGTKFLVRAFAKEEEVRVQVLAGQVSVYHVRTTDTPTKQTGVLLMPNQQVVFTRQTERFDKTLIDLPQLIKPMTPRKKLTTFAYNETPIPQVFQELQDAYGINIRYNKDAFARCQLTASLARETFEEKLAIVCKTVEATYEIIDGQVVISGNGCQ